ncbi:MAG: S53 family peptidase [Acidimicrobiales bacterium]
MKHHSVRTAIVGVAILGASSLFAAPAIASTPSSVTAHAKAAALFVALPKSVNPTTDKVTGTYHTAAMSVEVVLAPRDNARLQSLLKAVSTPGNKDYGHWLKAGQFDALFAPTHAQSAAVEGYLKSSGLHITSSSSPFLVNAVGSSTKMDSTFKTTLRNFVDSHGVSYYSNATALMMPRNLANEVLGVVGLTDTVRLHDQVEHLPASAKKASSASSCETGYVTKQELFAYVNKGTGFPYGYGGGPGCSGLTPSQTNSLYGAPDLGPKSEGGGVTTAVFELSWYQASDIDNWASQFYGSNYTPPLKNVVVLGGPLNPKCPTGDRCPKKYNGYNGDIEVDADIETQLAVSPDMSSLEVYNAPNDFTGQTELAEYHAIAKQDTAAVVSSSWAVCENDAPVGVVQAENEIFEQMATQGQSMFGAEGDTGAFECIRTNGTTIVNVLDPPAQPWVTSVGGTSLENYNPGTSPTATYPSGTETVWNTDDLCNESANEGKHPGLYWCAASGAGGGGNSQYWGRPYYQAGPGVSNPDSTTGNGTTQCSLAEDGTPCREVPDISADADEYTPYAEYCTGSSSTPYSTCATFSGSEPSPGWFGIGGTSLSSPLWSAIIADRDSYQGARSGNINPLIYELFNDTAGTYFHDITGAGQTTNNNGLFPTTPGYDLATGIGTPKMTPLITGRA